MLNSMLKQFEKGMGENVCTYPLTYKQIKDLKPCNIVSPRVGHHYNIKHPDDYNIEYSYKEVEKIRKEVKAGIYPQWALEKYYPYEGTCPTDLTAPLKLERLSKNDPEKLANVVHMDMTSDFPKACLRWLLSEGYNIKTKKEGYTNFLISIPNMEEKITNQLRIAGEKAFRLKWYFGKMRVETYLGYNLTAYPEGCPCHSSFISGHMFFALEGIYALIKNFEPLPDWVIKVLLDSAYLWGSFRVFAAVHDFVDGHGSLAASSLNQYMKKDLLEKYQRSKD